MSGESWRICLDGWTSRDALDEDGKKAGEWYEKIDRILEALIAKYSAKPVIGEPLKADLNFLAEEPVSKILIDLYGRDEALEKMKDYDLVMKPLNFEVLYFLSTKKHYCDLCHDEQRVVTCGLTCMMLWRRKGSVGSWLIL